MLWSSLKKHSGSRWVRTSYFWLFFVPIVAKTLSTLSDTLSFDLGGHHFVLAMALPFNWKLFYFGAVCFAFAGFIYQMLCPPLVRDFDSFSEYADVGKGSTYILDEFIELSMLGHMLRIYNRRYGPDMVQFVRQFTTGDMWHDLDFEKVVSDDPYDHAIRFNSEREGTQLEIKPEKLAEAFWFARNASDGWQPKTRYFCTALYWIGYALFFFVSCQGFWYVLKTL